MVESAIIRESNLTDIRMMSWGDGPDAFRENFRSLAEHCDYRLGHKSSLLLASLLQNYDLCLTSRLS